MKEIQQEITPITNEDLFIILNHPNAHFDYPIHCHPEYEINLVVDIVPWNNQKVYDRLGLDDQYMDILGVRIPMNTIPITPGRNLAVILEVAAMNNRQRKMGYNAALEFTEQINRRFDGNGTQK